MTVEREANGGTGTMEQDDASPAVRVTAAGAALERALDAGEDVRDSMLAFCAGQAADPRMARMRRRLVQKQLALRADDPDLQLRRVAVEEELAALDGEHARWFEGIPAFLLQKVHGARDRDSFLRVGESVCATVRRELPGMAGAGTVLDFGVGLGRVLWPMMQEVPKARFVGFDPDPMMLEQTERLDTGAELHYSTQPLPDGSVDAAYVISVFTHLGRTADFWLGELHRLLSPEGRAFVTYHDETLYSRLRASGQVPARNPAAFDDRILVGGGNEGSTQLATFYTTAHWEALLSRWFVVEKSVPCGLQGHQSFSVVRRRDVDVDRARLHHEYMCALEEELYRLRKARRLSF